MTRPRIIPASIALLVLVPIGAVLLSGMHSPVRTDLLGMKCNGRAPRIDPDYAGVTIPPNVAPLNFRILEEGAEFYVEISGGIREGISVRASDGVCRIPAGAWRRLLSSSKGAEIHFDIFVGDDEGKLSRFDRVTNRVAADPIDPYIVYRLLSPNRAYSQIRGIYQRSVESFETSPLVTLRDGDFTCFNCHTFHNHNPKRFVYHIRGRHAGMMLVTEEGTKKIDTKQGEMFRPLAYSSWHPGGRHIAATINMFRCFWPSTPDRQDFESVEKRGDLVVYDVEQNAISTTPEVFENSHIETQPCWSHDGKHIYFVRCKDRPLRVPGDLKEFKFDLMRIACDVEHNKWGEPDLVKEYSSLGKSCSFPRPSQCGRYVLHVLADQTTYPIHQNSSDLYMLDLETKKHTRLDDANSAISESYPRWSSNGRWFSFLSNRRDGVSALPYFAYFDEDGRAHKAFVLPMEDPEWYDTFVDTYNVLELVKSKVDRSEFELASGMRREAVPAKFGADVKVDAYSGATATQRINPGGHY